MKHSIKKLINFIFVTAALLLPGEILSAPKVWETLKIDHANSKDIIKDNEIEIYTQPSIIILNLNHSERIEIFTILGRLVSSETLHPGSYQFEVDAHGVYIVKVGELICKVAL